EYLAESVKVAEAMIDLFGDPEGGFFLTAKDHEKLIARTREVYDGALPSGNAVAVHALFKLAELTSNDRFKKAARAVLERHSVELSKFPQAFPHLASAADMALAPWIEIVVAGESPELLREVRQRYLPNSVLAGVPADGPDADLVRRLPMVEGKKAVKGRAAAYVCENYSCQSPVTTLEELRRLLDGPKAK
ncbi:MAG TPA: thioredoxin domain-containing protein, partial [Planctomycetota bacterium]|nr:thioredoxin domain-containing protein [Planctomycetota bacterium]